MESPKTYCPNCGEINSQLSGEKDLICDSCDYVYLNPHYINEEKQIDNIGKKIEENHRTLYKLVGIIAFLFVILFLYTKYDNYQKEKYRASQDVNRFQQSSEPSNAEPINLSRLLEYSEKTNMVYTTWDGKKTPVYLHLRSNNYFIIKINQETGEGRKQFIEIK
jgi:hypothetical protein